MLQLRVEKMIMAHKLVLIPFFTTFVMFFNYSFAGIVDHPPSNNNPPPNNAFHGIDNPPPNNDCYKELIRRFGNRYVSVWQSRKLIGSYALKFMYLGGISTENYIKTDYEVRKLIQERKNEDTTVRVLTIKGSRNADNKKKRQRNNMKKQKIQEQMEANKIKQTNQEKSEGKINNQTDRAHSLRDMIGVKDSSSTHQHEIGNSQKDGQIEDEKETDNYGYDYFLTYNEYLLTGRIQTPERFCRHHLRINIDCLITLQILGFGKDKMKNLRRAFYILAVDDYVPNTTEESMGFHFRSFLTCGIVQYLSWKVVPQIK